MVTCASREELLYCIGQQVRGGMTDDLEPVGVLVGDDAQFRIVIDDGGGIHQDAVHLAGERGFGQPRTDARSHFGDGNRAIELFLTSVRKRNYGHELMLPKGGAR